MLCMVIINSVSNMPKLHKLGSVNCTVPSVISSGLSYQVRWNQKKRQDLIKRLPSAQVLLAAASEILNGLVLGRNTSTH